MKRSRLDSKVEFVPLALPVRATSSVIREGLMSAFDFLLKVTFKFAGGVARRGTRARSMKCTRVSPVAHSETELTERASLHSSKLLLTRRSVAM